MHEASKQLHLFYDQQESKSKLLKMYIDTSSIILKSIEKSALKKVLTLKLYY